MTEQQVKETLDRMLEYYVRLGQDNQALILLVRGWWLHAVKSLEAALGPDREEYELRTQLREYALEKAEFERRRFPKLFEDACRYAGIPLGNSPHPRYSLDDDFIKIIIDEGKRTARIEDHEGELVTVPMDVAAVVERLREERKRLYERDFDGQKFVDDLYRDYKAIIEKEKRPAGDVVPIRRITARRGKNVDRFRVDEFVVDLARLSRQGPLTTTQGHVLSLSQTKDTRQGMLLPGDRGYIGFIQFTE